MYNPAEEYSNVRGFNFQPDWGADGVQIWLNFDGGRYREMLVRAKELFPKMNTLRIWLSFDAWLTDAKKFLAGAAAASKIIAEEGLRFMPVYFNGWFGLPSYGGLTAEMLTVAMEGDVPADFFLNAPPPIKGFGPCARYLRETVAAVDSEAVLMHDICNEPYNAILGDAVRTAFFTEFLRQMCLLAHEISSAPVTVGSQGVGFPPKIPGVTGDYPDVDLLAEMEDVISFHPYAAPPRTAETHLKALTGALAYAKSLRKPVLVTECCWAGKTDGERLPFLEIELPNYAALGLGFLAHALWESPVADLHRLSDDKGKLFMPFIDRDGNLRKGHEIFNRF